MAIDTRNRRASCINFDLGGSRVYPNPDGAISSEADRKHITGKYPGIASPAPGPGVGGARMLRWARWFSDLDV